MKLASIEGLVIQKVVEPLQNSGEVQKNSKSVDTSYVSQIEAFKQAESDDNNQQSEANISYSCDVIELDDEEPVNVNSLGNERTGLSIDFVSTVAKVEADVNTVISDDEDDDIMVLEQKLAAARQQLGSGRHYLETSKASSRAGNKVLGSSRYFLLKIAMTFLLKVIFIITRRAAVYIPSQRDEYIRHAGIDSDEESDNHEVEMVTLDDSESDREDKFEDDAVTIIGHVSNRNQHKAFMTRDPEQQQDEAVDNFEIEVCEF